MPRIIRVCGLVILFVLASGGLYFALSNRAEHPPDAAAYHQSQFFKYAEFVEDSVERHKGGARIDLDIVMAGIAPHHIPTTIPLLAELYAKLKNSREVKTFVVLAPDHVDMGQGDISVSRADFVTPFGVLHPNLAIIERLEKSGFIGDDEKPFEREHAIDSQLLFISRLFPDAKIVPLVFRSSITIEAAKVFGKILASAVDDDTFVVSSVDFSHYLSERQARPIDHLSATVLGAIDSGSHALVEADSTQALAALMSFLEAKGAKQYADLLVFNTRDFSGNSDYTTGYLVGFWGTRNGAN